MLAAIAAALSAGPVLAAKEKPAQPKEKKICRTVQMSGRITPERICRKVVAPATDEASQRGARNPGEAAKSGD